MVNIKLLKNTDFLLLLILIFAAVVRYWGIDFGLPNTICRPDEEFIVNVIYSPLRYFHPETFNYPSLYKYINLISYGLYFVFGLLIGKFRSLLDFWREFIINPEVFYLINRFISAFFGVATVFITSKITERLFDKKTAIISALFLSFTYLHVRDSHFGTVDVPLVFFIMCSILYIIKSYQDSLIKNYVLAGLFAGLATSMKYSGILLLIPMYIVSRLEARGGKRVLLFDRKMVVFVITLVAWFLLGTPYALIDTFNFIKDFLFEAGHLKYGHAIIFGRGWWYHLRFSLPFGLGESLFLASLIGMIILLKSQPKKAILLNSFPLAYYIIIGHGQTVFLRYIIPVIPFLCISGAIFTVYFINYLKKYLNLKLYRIVLFLIPSLIIWPSIYNILCFDGLLTKKDNRLIAAEWINNNIPQGSSLVQIVTYGRIQLSLASEVLKEQYATMLGKDQMRRDLWIKMAYLKENGIKGFNEYSYDRKLKKIKSGSGQEISNLPQYIIIEESPLKVYSTLTKEPKIILQESYHLFKAFKAINIHNKSNWFDQQDAFYMPFVGFKDIQRPGPNIYVYERNFK